VGLGWPAVGVSGQVLACFPASAPLLLAPASPKQGGSCSSERGEAEEMEGGVLGSVVAARSGEASWGKDGGNQRMGSG